MHAQWVCVCVCVCVCALFRACMPAHMCRVCILPRVQRFNLQTQIITSSRHTPIYTPTLNRLTHTHTSNAEVDRNLVDRCCIPIHAKAIQCHCQLHTQRSLSPTAAWELGKAAVVSDQVADDIEFGSRDPYLPLVTSFSSSVGHMITVFLRSNQERIEHTTAVQLHCPNWCM